MTFTAAQLLDKYEPRPQDASRETFFARVQACQTCPNRAQHTCRAAGQLCSVLARPTDAICPQRSWPGDPPLESYTSTPIYSVEGKLPKAKAPPAVAVILTSHAYGRFLTESIESGLSQSLRPAEVLVVDDASTDETPDVAARYADRGVRYLRVEHQNAHKARMEGLSVTKAPFVVFLDADDVLHPFYLQDGMERFSESRTGVVYSDLMEFWPDGREERRLMRETRSVHLENYLHAGCIVRRTALESSGVADLDIPRTAHEDWRMWRAVLDCGWKAVWSPGVYRYRRHAASETQQRWATKGESSKFYQLADLAGETITLFTPLSGRLNAWSDYSNWLDHQTWPHEQVRLVLCDTSQNEEFGQMVRDWICRCSYDDVRYYRQAVARPGLADEDRLNPDVCRAVQAAMPRIYNRLAREAATEFVWIVEDDIVPPAAAAECLLNGFSWGGKDASVSGAYHGRLKTQAWIAWDRAGRRFRTRGRGVQTIGGNGFGCVMLRASVLRQAVFQHAEPCGDYDPNFYSWLQMHGYVAKIDWDVSCSHDGTSKNAGQDRSQTLAY